ncbi:MAG: hypothetical protein ACM3WV_08335 [Bacillota bacterium]
MANKEQIQKVVDSCTQSAMMLRTAANSIVNDMARSAATSGATQIEMAITAALQAKNIT